MSSSLPHTVWLRQRKSVTAILLQDDIVPPKIHSTRIVFCSLGGHGVEFCQTFSCITSWASMKILHCKLYIQCFHLLFCFSGQINHVDGHSISHLYFCIVRNEGSYQHVFGTILFTLSLALSQPVLASRSCPQQFDQDFRASRCVIHSSSASRDGQWTFLMPATKSWFLLLRPCPQWQTLSVTILFWSCNCTVCLTLEIDPTCNLQTLLFL